VSLRVFYREAQKGIPGFRRGVGYFRGNFYGGKASGIAFSFAIILNLCLYPKTPGGEVKLWRYFKVHIPKKSGSRVPAVGRRRTVIKPYRKEVFAWLDQ